MTKYGASRTGGEWEVRAASRTGREWEGVSRRCEKAPEPPKGDKLEK